MLANEEKYEGEVKDGKRHGQGRLTLINGNVYEGQFVNGKYHGQGRCTYANGNVYVGDWTNGKRHGQGRYICAYGDMYEGEFMSDKIHGKGVMKFANGSVYEGDLTNGKPHGQGRFTCLNGEEYEGKFVKGKPHGQSRYTCLSGNVYSGVWVDGTLSDTNWELIEQGHSNGNLLISKRRIPYECIKLINESSNQPSSCTEDVVALLALKNSDIECPICYNNFATDLYTKNESVKNLLPIVGTCDHVYCHGCVLQHQNQIAKTRAGVVPQQIQCMLCNKEDAFRPNRPKYDRRLIDWLSRSMPVCTDVGSASV